jgi:hypothetical protein
MPIRRGCGSSGRTFEDVAKAFSVAANIDPTREEASISPAFSWRIPEFWRRRFRPNPVQDRGAHGFPMAAVLVRIAQVRSRRVRKKVTSTRARRERRSVSCYVKLIRTCTDLGQWRKL